MAEEPVVEAHPDRSAEASVDAALRSLARLVDAPPEEQVRGYDEVHRRLADALSDPAEG